MRDDLMVQQQVQNDWQHMVGVICLNQTTNTMRGAKKSTAKRDEEYRVWYVGVTRSMQNLYLIKSQNRTKEFRI